MFISSKGKCPFFTSMDPLSYWDLEGWILLAPFQRLNLRINACISQWRAVTSWGPLAIECCISRGCNTTQLYRDNCVISHDGTDPVPNKESFLLDDWCEDFLSSMGQSIVVGLFFRRKNISPKINSSPLENDADDPASFWRGKRRIFNGKLPGLLYTTHFSEPFPLRPQSWYGYMGRCQSFGVFPWHITAWTFCGLVVRRIKWMTMVHLPPTK